MVLIDNVFFLKTVISLWHRKRIVEKTFAVSGWLGFWLPIALFGVQVIYWTTRIFVMDVYMLAEIFFDTNLQKYKLNFIFDTLIMVIPFFYALAGYFAFGVRTYVAQIMLLIYNAGVVVISVVAIVRNFQTGMYIGAIVYAVLNIIITVFCIKAKYEDQLLAKIDGYPHFNATLMYEDEPEVSMLRFPDKKSYDELYDERIDEFVETFPDSEMTQMYKEQREQKRIDEINDWLGEMMPNKENDE